MGVPANTAPSRMIGPGRCSRVGRSRSIIGVLSMRTDRSSITPWRIRRSTTLLASRFRSKFPLIGRLVASVRRSRFR